MTENTAAAKARTARAFSSEGAKVDRPMPEGTEAVREFAQQGAAYSRDMQEKTNAAAEGTSKLLERTYSTVAEGAADFNLQWIEMVRANTNSAFDFAGKLIGVKSPSEFLELSASHASKQFGTFTEQAQHLTALAQKVTTEAVRPLRAGVTSALSKAV